MNARSLRGRILLGITLPAIAILGASSALLHVWIRADGLAHLDRSLETRAAAMAALIELEGGVWDVDFDGESAPVHELFGELSAYDVRVVENGDLLARRTPAWPAGDLFAELPTDLPQVDPATVPRDRPLPIGGAARTLDIDAGPTLRVWSAVYLVRAHDGASDDDAASRPGARALPVGALPAVHIAVAQDMAPLADTLRRLRSIQLAIGVGLSALAAASGLLLSRRIVDPIEAMAIRAERVTAPSPEPPLPTRGTGDEIDRLADTLNRSFGRLHEAYALQTRFTADASHELRTPLTVVRSQAEVALRRERTVEEYRAALAAVVSGAERMQDILDGLLLLARVDAGAEDRPYEPVNVAAIAREIVPAAHREGGPRLRFDGLDAAYVLGDRRHIECVVRNLLSNALQHTPPDGEVVVRLLADGDDVVLEVADTGEGIPPDALPHIFERFYRADHARSRARGGSGLGLSIVKVVVEQHGGSVAATSRPAEGTTIRVRLPRPRAEDTDDGIPAEL